MPSVIDSSVAPPLGVMGAPREAVVGMREGSAPMSQRVRTQRNRSSRTELGPSSRSPLFLIDPSATPSNSIHSLLLSRSLSLPRQSQASTPLSPRTSTGPPRATFQQSTCRSWPHQLALPAACHHAPTQRRHLQLPRGPAGGRWAAPAWSCDLRPLHLLWWPHVRLTRG
jgi:hypothetical protein